MRHFRDPRFKPLYDALPAHVRSLANKNLALLKQDPKHPSLHFKRIKDDLWSVRVGRSHRALTGVQLEGEAAALGAFRQSAAKIVDAWAVEGELDPAAIKSNTFTMEWPPRSGRMREVPEVDRAAWFSPDEAARKLLKGQRPILQALLQRLAKRG